jgi:acetyl esterase/lipase
LRFAVGREQMVERLAGHKVATEVVMLPNTPHSFWLFDPWVEPTVTAMAAFLARHLK